MTTTTTVIRTPDDHLRGLRDAADQAPDWLLADDIGWALDEIGGLREKVAALESTIRSNEAHLSQLQDRL